MPSPCESTGPVQRRLAATTVAWLAIAATWLLAGAPRASAAPSWTALHFATGTGFQHTLAVGDLNGDSRLDVATPNSVNSAVTVLLGNGDGTLALYHAYPAFGEPQDVQMADLTGDGILDLATPDYSGSGVTVLRGLGDGTFAPRVAYPVGAGLVSLATADLDGDTRLELVVSKESGNKVAVLPAIAGGGFGTTVEVASGATPHQIASHDFDHDGNPDVAVASFGAGVVSVHLGNGTDTLGAATPFACGSAPVGLTVADLNGDGHKDLLVTNVNAATLSVLLGTGAGTFAPAVTYPTDPRPRGMDAADLDGDGVPDVVCATGYPDGDSVLTVYRGLGNGSLAILDHLKLPFRAADCVIADMNGDGRRDIVTTGPLAGMITVLLNQGTASVTDVRRPGLALELTVQPVPARSAVTLTFRAPPGVGASLEIFDLAGRRVATLGDFAGRTEPRSATWEGKRSTGERAQPGVYFARLTSGTHVLAKPVVLLTR